MDRQYHHLLVTRIIIVIKYLYKKMTLLRTIHKSLLFKNRMSDKQRQLPLLNTENQENMRKRTIQGSFVTFFAIVIHNNHTL